MGPSWALRGWREESLAGWVSVRWPPSWEGPLWPAWRGPSLCKTDGGWLSLSSLTLWLKGAWQPHVAVMTLLPPVPSHSCGKCFWQQGSGKMFLDPERGSCPARPVGLASPRLWVQDLAGLPCRCSVRRQHYPVLWEGPVAWGQASGQNLRRCSLSELCK